MFTKIFLTLIVALSTFPARGQESTEEDISPFVHCIQISPLGLLGGSLAGNVERLAAPGHGLGLEGSYTFLGDNDGFGMGGFYRFYLGKTMRDNFFGLFARYFEVENEMVIKDEKYPFKLNGSVIGGHFGGRWIHKKGFNFTWRAGFGYPMSEFYWGVSKSNRPEDASAIKNLTLVMSGLDLRPHLDGLFKYFPASVSG